ncbi:hypothetical protein [Haloferula sp. BvORR071]|uniref:hypothetical protein n=1 Tax=Haloferula sp. BvORR071 TaxID=1396141 RepID=UPI00054F939A|nr:hypothetical protein [Haloferula sp. BvORR071]
MRHGNADSCLFYCTVRCAELSGSRVGRGILDLRFQSTQPSIATSTGGAPFTVTIIDPYTGFLRIPAER